MADIRVIQLDSFVGSGDFVHYFRHELSNELQIVDHKVWRKLPLSEVLVSFRFELWSLQKLRIFYYFITAWFGSGFDVAFSSAILVKVGFGLCPHSFEYLLDHFGHSKLGTVDPKASESKLKDYFVDFFFTDEIEFIFVEIYHFEPLKERHVPKKLISILRPINCCLHQCWMSFFVSCQVGFISNIKSA